MDVLNDLVLPKFDRVKKQAGYYMVRCPAHDDNRASLSISRGKEHPVVLHCHAGCDRDAILAAIGLTWDDLCKPREDDSCGEWTPRGEAVAIYDYVDEQGSLLFQVCRTASKEFPQRAPDPSKPSGWRWRLDDVRRVLYRLPKIIEAADEGAVIYICEGEKDVHALESEGAVATCNPGGAGKWRLEYAECFRDIIAVIVADKDKAGYAHARQVAASLEGIARGWEVVEAAVGKDAADHIAAGHGLGAFVSIASSEAPTVPELAPDLHEFLGIVDPPQDWVIEDILERGDRLMLTGHEGYGKSTLLRQLAVAAAAGLHPFSSDPAPARLVLFIDCENSERQARRKLRPFDRAATIKGRRVPDGGMRLIHKPAGIDLTREDAAWLMERVTAHKPDLLVIGPLYRLHAADTNEEGAARTIVQVLDAVRTKVDCALIVEAHSGHGEAGKRSVRPTGSSLFLRWPEFGYGLVPTTDDGSFVKVQPWRGPRDERRWPHQLMRSTRDYDWPWIDATSDLQAAGKE